MPTYAYACKDCDHQFDVVQSFSDDSLTVCPECEGSLRKKFNSVGVVFKGSGFYRTDSRNGSASGSNGAGANGAGSKDSGSGGSGSSEGSGSGSSGGSSESSGGSSSGSSGSGSSGSGGSGSSSGSSPKSPATTGA